MPHAARRLLMIALDAADPALIEGWTSDGTLPHLDALRRHGVSGRLATSARYLAGSAWPTFYSGQPPSRHGLYHDFQWRHDTMTFAAPRPDWLSASPFWRHLGGDVSVIAYDVPMGLGVTPFNGLEVSGWAAHDKLAPPASHPADLLDEIERRFGEWHIGPEQYGPSPVAELLELRDALLEGTRRSADLALWLLERPWNLAIVAFGALHRGGHRLFDRTSIAGPDSALGILILLLRPYGVSGAEAVALSFLQLGGTLVMAGLGELFELRSLRRMQRSAETGGAAAPPEEDQ
ncbi:MAG: alkaline phosphatase family protein [Gemmatimonadales bacterium]